MSGLSGGAGALEGGVGGVRPVWLPPQAAGPRAEDLALLGQEGASQQGVLAAGAAEATFGGVPVLPVVRHLPLVDACGERAETEKTKTLEEES